ncbi:myosin-16-like isoform X2 [Gouania willdenowi]|uniref:myosin-16-like isoform X2 n=1 Tax=Gouania willdenowi TaxID=441366 RepID=UPI0010567918|nr:myosin-16-like isoform X2 [Gouania willdenowi]
MERCLKEGERAEERVRLMAVTLEKEVTELRRDLSLAVDHKLKAEREKQDAQLRVIAVTSQLEETRSDKAKLQHESVMVMENVNLWIKEQKASKHILTSQIQVQHKELIINTTEKQHLQEANDTLKAEVKTLKATLDEKDRQMQRFKAQIQDCSVRKDNNNAEMMSCVAQKLSNIEDMQSKLHSNLRAIRKLNQQACDVFTSCLPATP